MLRTFNLSLTLGCLILCISSCKETEQQQAGLITTASGKQITFSQMDQFLKTQMDSFGLPGLSIAVINNAKIVYHRALGVTSLETKEKVNDKTLFDAGSMAKTPFAFMVMKMVEQGFLDLDTPLYQYLPNEDIAHDERYRLITARMALNHTSGFPNWRFLNDDGKLDIKFTPGTQFLYSGEGFEYLAEVIAHLKGIKKDDLQEFFRKEISTPLGMPHAYYTWNEYLTEHRAQGYVDGNSDPGWGISAKDPHFYAAYSLQTESVAYAKFLIAMIKERGLAKKEYDEMLKKQVSSPDMGAPYWGLGIGIVPSEHGTEYVHGGYNLNFSSSFLINKEHQSGYAFFTNCNKGPDFNNKLKVFLQ